MCVQNAPFKATSSFFNPFWLHLLFFMHLLIILSYKTLKLKSISNELWKGWKLAWYHRFIHIACARKLRGLRQKLDALRVQNGQSLSKYQDFIRKLVCYKGISFFKTYLNSWLFVCSKCTIQSHIINFQSFWLHLLFCMHLLIILSYKTIKLKSISNELRKGWKLAWYHHFIHIACARKLRGLRKKLDALRVQNRQSPTEYQYFICKLVCYKGISFFELIWAP